MKRPQTARAVIELHLGAEAPEGVLTDAAGHPRTFRGWIELACAIEDWRAGHAGAVPTDARPHSHLGGTP